MALGKTSPGLRPHNFNVPVMNITQGNLTFSGVGQSQRIMGDFSSGLPTVRTLFQTTILNGNTNIACIPNGTSLIAAWTAYNNSTLSLANASQLGCDGTAAYMQSLVPGGSGAALLPMDFRMAGATPMRIATSGNVLVGTTTDAGVSVGVLQVVSAQSTTTTNNFGAQIALTTTALSGSTLDAALNCQITAGAGWAKTGGASLTGARLQANWNNPGGTLLNHLAGAIVVNSVLSTGTIPNITGFLCNTSSNSGGATITNCQGVYVADQTIGTNNFAVNLNVTSGANKWNVYAQGTAINYFAARTLFGTTTDDTSSAVQVSGLVKAKRFSGNLGSVLVATDYVASSGWGTSPTKTAVIGTDTAATFTIVAKATVGANPTITLTFHDGTWTNVPVVVVCQVGLQTAAGSPTTVVSNEWVVTSTTATQVVFTFNGTPVANDTYGFSFVAIGT
jgi:hypothetical protein